MITVGLDFGTHQTKICYENEESGTVFYDVFRFRKGRGNASLTLPSFIRMCADGTLMYGHEALEDDSGGIARTYFKQVMFSWTANNKDRTEAEMLSALYLAFVIFKLDAHFKSTRYIVQMGMPTDANPRHYSFCKRQAIKVMSCAMYLARDLYKGDLESFLKTPFVKLKDVAEKYIAAVPLDINETRRKCPVFVFPEAYVALIPLINDRKLPKVGPNLFVDIGGGTVDISFFTNQMSAVYGDLRPRLYYYHSIPYGLNMITRQNIEKGGSVKIDKSQITRESVLRFHRKLINAIDTMMGILKKRYIELERHNVMPFSNLCGQVLDRRPVCYSGGGSMFNVLNQELENQFVGGRYNFSQVTTVSKLIDHSKLYVTDEMFHVLATAFALSHNSLVNRKSKTEPDLIELSPIDDLLGGVRKPQTQNIGAGGGRKWSW